MDLGFTSGLAELLEEQRRKRELEALQQQQEAAAAQQEPAATSPVLTPEVSTSGAQTAAPAGDSAAVSGQASPGNLPRNTTGGLAGNGRQTTGQGSFRQGIGGGLADNAVRMLRRPSYSDPTAQDDPAAVAPVAAPVAAPPADVSGLAPLQGEGNVRPPQLSDQTPDPNANISAAIADQRGIGGQLRSLNQLERGGPITAQPNEQAQFDTQRDAENKVMGNIGAALAKAGVAPPNITPPEGAPADPLAPKPKLTARQRAEAEIPAVDDMKGWQKVLLVMGAGLAGGLTKDASLGAKLAAMTPQNRRKRLVDERIKEIQEQDKLDLDTRQIEAQIKATEQGQVRADRQLGLTAKEQEFNQGLQLARLDLDVKRFKLDQDIRTMQAETARQVAADRAEYNKRIAQIREDALKAGKVLPVGAQFIHPETGQLITENPYQPQVTTSKDTETVIAPDGKTATVTKERTETKSRGGGEGTVNASSEKAARRSQLKRLWGADPALQAAFPTSEAYVRAMGAE